MGRKIFLFLLLALIPNSFVLATPRIRQDIQKPEDIGFTLDGLRVLEVEKKSIADKMRLRKKDVITQCNGQEVADWSNITQSLCTSPYHSTFSLTVTRHGLSGRMDCRLEGDLLHGQKLKFARYREEIKIPIDIGLLLQGHELLVSEIIKKSPCDKKIKPGDKIIRCLDKPVASWSDILTILKEDFLANEITLTIQRDGQSEIIPIKLSKLEIPTSKGQGGKTGKVDKEIQIKDKTRQYELVVPEKAADGKPIPLILILHGTQSAPVYVFQFWKAIVGDEAILVAPHGWGDHRGWNPQIDDDFVMALLEEVKNAYNINLSRVYVTGHSAGARYTYYWGRSRGGLFAAAGIFGGGKSPWLAEKPDKRKCPVIIYNGELDELVLVAEAYETEKLLKQNGHEVKLIVEKGGLPDPHHHEMNLEGTGAIWGFFKKYTLLD